MAAIGERVQRFFESFLAPLLLGGSAEVSQPYGPAYLDYAAGARPASTETTDAIYAAFYDATSRIVPSPPIRFPDRGAMALALAGHDLLTLTDPLLDRLWARSAPPKMLELAAGLIASAGRPATRGEALARHVVVSRFLRLVRHDVKVQNWAYTYRFHGRPVPGNVVALPRLRRVRRESSERHVLELLREAEERWSLPMLQLVRAFIGASPLTPLLMPGSIEGHRLGVAEAASLRDAALRRAVVRVLRESSEDDLARACRLLLESSLADLPVQGREAVLRLFVELGLEDTLDRDNGATMEALVRGRAAMQLGAALFVAGTERSSVLDGLSEADVSRVRERASDILSALPADTRARAAHLADEAFVEERHGEG